MSELINHLHIHDVYQDTSDEKYIDIFFHIDNRLYCMRVMKFEDGYQPRMVFHRFDFGVCLICREERRVICEVLDRHVNDLFNRLIQFPNVRLEWLYISYKERDE